jgi:hypothetical protein
MCVCAAMLWWSWRVGFFDDLTTYQLVRLATFVKATVVRRSVPRRRKPDTTYAMYFVRSAWGEGYVRECTQAARR